VGEIPVPGIGMLQIQDLGASPSYLAVCMHCGDCLNQLKYRYGDGLNLMLYVRDESGTIVEVTEAMIRQVARHYCAMTMVTHEGACDCPCKSCDVART